LEGALVALRSFMKTATGAAFDGLQQVRLQTMTPVFRRWRKGG